MHFADNVSKSKAGHCVGQKSTESGLVLYAVVFTFLVLFTFLALVSIYI